MVKTFSFENWEISNYLCGVNLSYEALLLDGSYLPSFISFNSSSRTFIVFTNDSTNAGDYQIQVQGFDSFYLLSDYVSFTLSLFNKSTSSQNHDPNITITNQRGNYNSSNPSKTKIWNYGLTAFITNISSLGLVSIYFNEPVLPFEYLGDIEEDIFKFTINNAESDLISSWNITYFQNQRLDLQLTFTDPLQIDTSDTADTIQIQFAEASYFQSIDMRSQIPNNYVISKQLPSQFASAQSENNLNLYAQQCTTVFTVATSLSFALQILLNGSLSVLWGLVNTLQLLVYVSLFNIILPINLSTLISYIIGLLNFNYFDLGAIETEVLSLQSNYTTYNDRVVFLGYTSSNFFLNMGFSMSTLFIYPGLLVSYLIIKRFAYKLVIQISDYLKSFLFFNGLLRYFIETTLELCISAVIQISINDYSGPGDYISLIVAVFMLAVTIVISVFPIYLLRNKHLLKDEKAKGKFKEFYEGMKKDRNVVLIFPSLYFFRRFAFLVLAFFVPDYPSLQVMGFLVLNLFILFYLTYIEPYKSFKRFFIEVFNEVCHVTASYILLGFTGINGNASSKYFAGWCYYGIMLVNFIVNISFVAHHIYQQTRTKYLKVRLNRKIQLRKTVQVQSFVLTAQISEGVLRIPEIKILGTINEEDPDEEVTPQEGNNIQRMSHIRVDRGSKVDLRFKMSVEREQSIKTNNESYLPQSPLKKESPLLQKVKLVPRSRYNSDKQVVPHKPQTPIFNKNLSATVNISGNNRLLKISNSDEKISDPMKDSSRNGSNGLFEEIKDEESISFDNESCNNFGSENHLSPYPKGQMTVKTRIEGTPMYTYFKKDDKGQTEKKLNLTKALSAKAHSQFEVKFITAKRDQWFENIKY